MPFTGLEHGYLANTYFFAFVLISITGIIYFKNQTQNVIHTHTLFPKPLKIPDCCWRWPPTLTRRKLGTFMPGVLNSIGGRAVDFHARQMRNPGSLLCATQLQRRYCRLKALWRGYRKARNDKCEEYDKSRLETRRGQSPQDLGAPPRPAVGLWGCGRPPFCFQGEEGGAGSSAFKAGDWGVSDCCPSDSVLSHSVDLRLGNRDIARCLLCLDSVRNANTKPPLLSRSHFSQ